MSLLKKIEYELDAHPTLSEESKMQALFVMRQVVNEANERVEFIEQIQNKLQTLKSDAPTWKAAIMDRIEYYQRMEQGHTVLGEREQNLSLRISQLEDELRVTDQLLIERQKVLDAIPPCPVHGPCVPHALNWIAEKKVVKE